mmetsp:Transcript_94145/g.167454  ORF Transcript_94145/g.167454 Transcript_94145/m.167454 type:complete len:289 (+) Transcript_94145:48-914(+)
MAAMDGCSYATRRTFMTYLHRGCCMPMLYGNGYRICQELSWQSGQLKVDEDLCCLDMESTCDQGDCFSRLSSDISCTAEYKNKRLVSTDALLKDVGNSISSTNVATIISFPSGDMATSEMVSQGFEELSGYSNKECLSKDLRFLTFSSEDIADTMARNLSERTGACTITDMCMLTKSGELKACRVLRRGLTLGFDPELQEQMWLVLSVFGEVAESSAEEIDVHLSEVAADETGSQGLWTPCCKARQAFLKDVGLSSHHVNGVRVRKSLTVPHGQSLHDVVIYPFTMKC